jgi:hypothetical protein
VLTQAMERVLTVGRHNEALKRVVAFATTGVKSWIFILEREFPDAVIYGKGEIVENYHLFPIDIAEIIPLWHCLNEKPSDFFIHEDCFLLSDILSSVGYHLGYCQLKLLHRTVTGPHISAIYEVTPCIKESNKSYVTVPAPDLEDAEENSFVIKLLLGSPRGTNEYVILESLSNKKCFAVDYVHMGIRSRVDTDVLDSFHGIAGFSPSKNHVDSNPGFSLELRKNALGFKRFTNDFYKVALDKTYHSPACEPELCWWNYATENRRNTDFTAIFMRVGYRVKAADGVTVSENGDLRHNLRELHSCEVLHCDPRLPNIMRFLTSPKNSNTVKEVSTKQKTGLVSATTNTKDEEKAPDLFIRLVDFDLSVFCKAGSTTEMDLAEAGGQRDLLTHLPTLPVVINKRANGQEFVVICADIDREMLGRTIDVVPRMEVAEETKDPKKRAEKLKKLAAEKTFAGTSVVLFHPEDIIQAHGTDEEENTVTPPEVIAEDHATPPPEDVPMEM